LTKLRMGQEEACLPSRKPWGGGGLRPQENDPVARKREKDDAKGRRTRIKEVRQKSVPRGNELVLRA